MESSSGENQLVGQLCKEVFDFLADSRDADFLILLRSYARESVVKERDVFWHTVQDVCSLERKNKKLKERLAYHYKHNVGLNDVDYDSVTDMENVRRLLGQTETKIQELRQVKDVMENIIVDQDILSRWVLWVDKTERKIVTMITSMENAHSVVNGKKLNYLGDIIRRLRESKAYYCTLREDVIKLCEETRASYCRAAVEGRKCFTSEVECEYVQKARALCRDYGIFIENQRKYAESFRQTACRLGLVTRQG